ncbi:MAG: histidine phosphatase family protein [Deltaproteobacteria bacterium]|nr:histidine phosphatase family protein [Deltaproteobacteria bacterium]
MRITFVRHGESESNFTGHWQGQGDSQLSPLGRDQAESLRGRLASTHFDRVISSDLSRAADTARALGREVTLEPAFRELDVGDWEGLDRREVALKFPDQVQVLAAGARDVKIGGGESWDELYDRIKAAFDAVVRDATEGSHIAVVSHGGAIAALFAGLLGIGERNPRPLGRVVNTALSTVEVQAGELTLRRWNDATHLGPVGAWAEERLSRGDGVVGLVSHDQPIADEPFPEGGRLRGGPSVLAIEHLGEWYRGLKHLYAAPLPQVRNAGAMLAARNDIILSDAPIAAGDLDRQLSELSERHRGERASAVLPSTIIGDYVNRLVGPTSGAKIAPPRHATVTHTVTTDEGLVLADFGCSPRS